MKFKKSQIKKLLPLFLISIFLVVYMAYAIPQVEDLNDDNIVTSNSTVEINYNFSIPTDEDLANVTFSWDGVNYSLYDEDLVLFYNFDNRSELEENDTYVKDLSRYGNFGNVTGNAVWNSSGGKSNGAFDLNGKSSYIDVFNVTDTNFENFTACLWFNIKGNTSNDWETHYMLGQGDDYDPVWGWHIRVNTVESMILSAYIGNGSANGQISLTSYYVDFNEWNFACLVQNGSNFTFYANSEIVESELYNGFAYDNTKFDKLRIGALSNSATYYHVNGTIDDVMIWNRTLTDDEIEQLYYTSLTKYDSENWTLSMNSSLDFSINSTFPSYDFNYSLCISNSTFDENCSDNSIITQVIPTQTLTANFTTSVGTVREDFYGVLNARGALSNISWIDIDADGDLDSNDVLSNYTWEREAFLNSGLRSITLEMGLDDVASSEDTFKDSSDVTFRYYASNIDIKKEIVKWAYENDISVYFRSTYMPEWLANTSANCSLKYYTCPPENLTEWGNLVVNYLWAVSDNGTYISSIKGVIVWNEPESASAWMSDLPENNVNNMIRMTYYNELYNVTYVAVKDAYPNIEVGGPDISGFGASHELLFLQGFLSNFSGQTDFVSFHEYRTDTEGDFDDLLDTRLSTLFSNCDTYGVNCSRIILGEWAVRNSTLQNTTSYSDMLGLQISLAYYELLKYPTNITSTYFMWNEKLIYTDNGNYPEYPQRWSMVSEPQLDNEFYPPYNVTKNFATYHPSLSTVYTSTSDDDDVKIVSSKINNTYGITIINTGTESVNVSLDTSGALSTLTDEDGVSYSGDNFEIGILDGYEIKYLTYDPDAPAVTINSPVLNMQYLTSTLDVNVTLSEEGSWCGYSLNGANNISMTKENNYFFAKIMTGLTEGSYSIVITCNDTFNNINSAKTLFTVKLSPDSSSPGGPGGVSTGITCYKIVNEECVAVALQLEECPEGYFNNIEDCDKELSESAPYTESPAETIRNLIEENESLILIILAVIIIVSFIGVAFGRK